MKLAFLVCIVLAVAAKQVYSQACHMREIDLCLAIGIFQFQSNGIPPDEEKVNEWCEAITEVHDCMRNYSTKCMSPVQQEMAGLFSGALDVSREICTAGSEVRTRYLEHAKCLSEASVTDEFRTIMKDYQVGIETLFDTVYAKRFPLMCCTYNRFQVAVQELTNKRCGFAATNMIRDILKMIATDLPEIVCQSYDAQSDQCKALLPPSGTPSKGPENKSHLGKLLDTALGNL